MENGSRALLISSGIIIAMLILGIGVYLFMNYSKLGETYNQVLTSSEITKINNNFTKFEGKTNITAQEILTLNNFVNNYNEKTEEKINITVTGYTKIDIKFLESNSDKYFKFQKIEYYDNGLVKLIGFGDI